MEEEKRNWLGKQKFTEKIYANVCNRRKRRANDQKRIKEWETNQNMACFLPSSLLRFSHRFDKA